MRNALINLSLAVALFAPIAASASPIVYNAATGFSTASDPNSVWSYGNSTPGGAFTAFTFSNSAFNGNAGYNYWSTGADTYDLVGHNTNNPIVPIPGFSPRPPSDALWLHPGNADDQAATVVFTAAVSGTYNFAGLFERADSSDGSGNGVGVSIYENGSTVLLGRQVISNSKYLASVGFNDTIFLNAGDSLDFIVDNNGDYSFDSTALKLDVTQNPIPEPSSLVLFGTGILGLATTARRKFFA